MKNLTSFNYFLFIQVNPKLFIISICENNKIDEQRRKKEKGKINIVCSHQLPLLGIYIYIYSVCL